MSNKLRRVGGIFLKSILVTAALLMLAAVGIFSASAINRWRYSVRFSKQTASRPPRQFYVRPSGSDQNPGTAPDRAWKTIAKVNQQSFAPGDSILFEGGQQFAGNLVLSKDDVGTSAMPIRVASFGSGKAGIVAASGNAILINDTGGIAIENLRILGTNDARNGIILYDDLFGGVKIPYVRVDSVEVSGFTKFGIAVSGNKWKSGFQDVRIVRSSTHDNALAGIYVYAVFGNFLPFTHGHAHRNIYVGDSIAYNNSGVQGSQEENSGSGIVLSDVDNGIIERSTAFNNGFRSNSEIGGPVGIWAWDSDSITIQYNRSFNNRSAGPKDGGGFDLDGGVTNSVMQYNYSSGNDGGGYLVCMFPHGGVTTNNVVRYNVSVNDGRKNSYGAIHLFGGVENLEIYNNTLVVEPARTGSPVDVRIVNSSKNVEFRNNIFFLGPGLSALRIDPMQHDLRFQENNYIAADQALKLEWGNTTYQTLAEFRAATSQETRGSRMLGAGAQCSTTEVCQDFNDLLQQATQANDSSAKEIHSMAIIP